MLNVEFNLTQGCDGCCKNMKTFKNCGGKEIIYFAEDDVVSGSNRLNIVLQHASIIIYMDAILIYVKTEDVSFIC